MTTADPETIVALDTARTLAAAGIPVFIAPPDPSSSTGYSLPRNWQQSAADPTVIDRWQPGWAVAAVMGHGFDVIDIDPRNGGDPSALNGRTPRTYGVALTPSGGLHSFIRSLGVAKKTNLLPGIDLQAGAPDGKGRGFVFLAPTVRASKTTGELLPYRWAMPLDLDGWRTAGPSDVSGFALAELVRGATARQEPGAITPEEFMDSAGSPWANVEATLAGGRNNGVAKLAASLRGRGGWREDDAIRFMYAEVWPLVDQEQGGHSFSQQEFEQTIRAQFRQYPDGGEQRDELAATPPQPLPDGSFEPPSLLRYFTEKNSLQALTLAGDVMSLGPLAQGTDGVTWAYRSGVWRQSKHIVRDRVIFLVGERYRPGHTRNVEDIVLSAVPAIACEPVPDYVNFRNGLLDWRTGQLHPHTPDVPTTVQLNVDFQPDAQCPRFERFLTEVVPPDAVPVVWDLVGYLMYSGNPLHKAVMLTGTGRNGKGTLLHVIEALLGRANVTNVSLHSLLERFGAASLFGKLANIAGDIDGTYIDNTAVFKAITGGDTISAELKYKDRFDFTPWAVPVFSANKVPPSADTTIGYLSRWLIINFPNEFTGREDRGLERRLTEPGELAGIAARAITALPALLARGDFELTESSKAARDDFVRRVDQVRTWLHDCCELHPDLPFTPRTPLYQAYQRWAARDGHRPVKASEFYDRIEAAGALAVKVMGERGYRGIHITDQGHYFAAMNGPAPAPTPAPNLTALSDHSAKTAAEAVQGQVLGAGTPDENGHENPANTDVQTSLGQLGQVQTQPYIDTSRAHTYESGWEIPAPPAPKINSAGIAAGLIAAKQAAAPEPPTSTLGRVNLRDEYLELKRQQDLRCENATRGVLTDKRGRDSEEVLRYYGEGEFAGSGVEPRLTWTRFLEQRRPERELEKAQDAAWDAGAKLGRRHATKTVANADAEYERALKGHDPDTFSDGYIAGITEYDRKVSAAAGELVALPAVVTRDGAVRSIDRGHVRELLAAVGGTAELTVDVETTGYPIGHADYALRTVQIGSENLAVVFDATDPDQCRSAQDLLLEADVLHAHSATADLVPLAIAGIVDLEEAWVRMHDTVIPAKLADPSSTGSDPGLKQIAGAMLGDRATAPAADAARSELFKTAKWLTDVEPTTPIERSGWAQVDPHCTTMVRYAASDVLDDAAIAKRLPAVTPHVLERERTAQRMTARVAHRGLRIDGEHVNALLPVHRNGLAEATTRLQAFGVVNAGSDQQIAAAAIQLGAKLPATKTGRPSVARGALERYRELDGQLGDFVRARLDYQRHENALGLFLEPYHELVVRGDGRARPTVYTLGADTGRMSCVRPNLQQVPREGGFRACITADPGTLLVSADFAGVELRVAAALSGDRNLRHMIANGIDVHWEIARLAFGPEATKSDRYAVKRGVFGRIYGGGIPAIARGVGVSETIAAAIIDSLDTMLPELAAWSHHVREAVKAGHAQFPTYAGRVIHLPQAFPHKAPNYCIQGTARELLVDTLMKLRDTRWGEATLLPVHDELVLVVPEDEAAAATQALIAAMETDLHGVAIKAEASEPSYAWKDAS